MLGEYLNLRQLFTPTLRQSKAAASRFSQSGDQGFELRRARRYANPQNFVRNGWSADTDMLRIATGDMIERVYKVTDPVQTPQRNPEIERVVLLCIDGTSSMNIDGRGRLRNLIVPSYIDQMFTKAKIRNEKITAYVIIYADKVKYLVRIGSIEEATKLFASLSENEFSVGSTADHANAIIYGIQEVIKTENRVSHLNVVLLTDGEEDVNISKIKSYTDKITVGPEGLRLGIGAISLVSGQKTVEKTIQAISQSDARYMGDDPPMQFFDRTAVAQWTSSAWTKTFLGSLSEPVWVGRAETLSRLGEALRRINMNEIDPPTQASVDDFGKDPFGGDDNSEQKQGDVAEAPSKNAKPEESDKKDGESSQQKEAPADLQQRGPLREERLDSQSVPHNWSADEILNNTVVYKIIPIASPLPRFLGIARVANLPQSLSRGMTDALRANDVIPIRVSDNPQKFDLSVEAMIPSRIVGGIAAIAKPNGYALAGLTLRDVNGTPLRRYRAFEIVRNGLYLLNFGSHVSPSGSFVYTAYYIRDVNQNRRSPLFDKLQRESLTQVSAALLSDQILGAAKAIYALATRRWSIKIEDVAKTVNQEGIYTFTKEKDIVPTTNGRFAIFQKFLVGERLHYQCNGANPLLAGIINMYGEKANQPNLVAETVAGYSVQEREVKAGQAHMVTFASDREIPYSHLLLDATPTEADKDVKHHLETKGLLQRLANKISDIYWQASDRVTLPIRRRYEANLEAKLRACAAKLAPLSITTEPLDPAQNEFGD
jgi:hypothetical protein